MSNLKPLFVGLLIAIFCFPNPAYAPPPDKCDTWPNCDDSGNDGGNGNGGTGTSNEIVGTEYADGGELEFAGGEPQCTEITLTGFDDRDDVIKGLDLNDCLNGKGGDDNLQGGSGDDWLIGGAGNDVHAPGPGNDVIYAGSGEDRILGDTGCDYIDGGDQPGDGPGGDWISYNTDQMQMVVNFSASPVTPTIDGVGRSAAVGTIIDVRNCPGLCGTSPSGCEEDTVLDVETVTLTANDDYVFGGPADEFFGGGRGDDCIDGGDGNDFIGADRGDDVLIGGPGDDVLRGAENNDEFRFSLGDGDDIIEDFNPRADCIRLSDDLTVHDINTTENVGGRSKPDSIILLDSGDTITVWDISLDEADLGCTEPMRACR